MVKKFLIISIVSLSIIAFSGIAWCSVEGNWDVVGKITVKVSIKGHGSQTARTTGPDEFTFYSDGQFEMIDMDGSWTQKKQKFIVYLDPTSVEDYYASGLSEEIGSDVSVTVTKITFTGTEQKNGTIKGTVKLSMNFYIEDYDLSGKISATINYAGTRSEGYTSSIKERAASQLDGSLLDVVKEELNNAIPSDEEMR
jgi:hypothetical protein